MLKTILITTVLFGASTANAAMLDNQKKLSLDEWQTSMTGLFKALDANHNGYLEQSETKLLKEGLLKTINKGK